MIPKTTPYQKDGRKEWVFLHRFQQLGSCGDELETLNQEEIPFSSQIVPRGLSVHEAWNMMEISLEGFKVFLGKSWEILHLVRVSRYKSVLSLDFGDIKSM